MQEESLLSEAESLHLSALQLATSSLGECNLQTADHYGCLGSLYQVKVESEPFSNDP